LKEDGQLAEALRQWKVIAGMEAVWPEEITVTKDAKKMLAQYASKAG
jgi:hypothetical protein